MLTKCNQTGITSECRSRPKRRSPADGKVHRGRQREENRRETGLKLRRGDDLVVLAHKTKPEETRKH
jgi:hypothetical protein